MLKVQLALAAIALCGCGGMGALQQTNTSDDCPPGDTHCNMAGLSAPLAVGATTRPSVQTQLRGTGTPSLALWSAAPDILSVRDGDITGHQPGVSALVMSMTDGTAIDFVHVWVEQPERLQLHRLSAEGSDLGEVRDTIELVAGESIRIAPRPYAAAQRLIGEGPTEWTVAPPLADVLREGAHGRRRLVARHPGQATITVSSLGLSSTMQIVVHEPIGTEVTP
jgi:hypothetical protein